MISKRMAQSDRQQKSDKPQESGILQRAAVRSVSDVGMQSTDNQKDLALSNSAFSKDFSRVPISMTKPPQIMAKLTIGAVGDKYEQEADRVAVQVVQRINAPASLQSGEDETVQREEMETEDNEARLMRSPILQRRSSDGRKAATPNLEASINRARSGGQSMANNIRQPMEKAFGADFSGVKVHTDAHSDQLNQSIQARAFTTGQNVFFRQGEYNPGSRGGQELIAHELTHVMQQNGGAVQRTPRYLLQHQQYQVTETTSASEGDRAIQGSGEMTGNRHDSNRDRISIIEGLTIQRLALQYGTKPPIPEDATKIAEVQDKKRIKVIPVQMISNQGTINIAIDIYDKMKDKEEIFLVAHGRPALGNEPAMLEFGEGNKTLSSERVADIIRTIVEQLKTYSKTIGRVKIEACMSSLSRKTSGSFFDNKPSLIENIKNSLKSKYNVNEIILSGNLGFSAGLESDEKGVEVTPPLETNVGLLEVLAVDIEKAIKEKVPVDSKVKDALNILQTSKSWITKYESQQTPERSENLKELIGSSTVLEYLTKGFNLMSNNSIPDSSFFSLLSILTSHAKQGAQSVVVG
ncbi:eCIS core domain-containing protein [Nostoc sp.]|uniref:eCIS core domain-containing protein n=1 Tax=Nostoc sp. TaxID=1180 RepID=UPI002FF9E10F